MSKETEYPAGPYQPLQRSLDDPPSYFEANPTAPAPVMPANSPIGFVHDDYSIRPRAASQVTIPNTTEVNEAPVVVTRGVPLASKSIDVVCPHCQTSIRTSIEKRPGLLAYLSGAVIACLCCFCGCCLIPCCIEECMEVKHTCPNCDGLVGKYRL